MKLRAAFVLLLTCAAAHAETTSLRARLDALVQPLVRDRWMRGVSVAVIQPAGVTYAGYGRTGGEQDRVPGPQTPFVLASISKTFSGALLAEAVGDGLLALEDPVARHLPAGPAVPEVDGKPITLLDLATHYSGLVSDPASRPVYDDDPYAGWTTAHLRADVAAQELLSAPGAKSGYSNLGISLMLAAVEHRRGASFAELLRERIARPLGMTATRVGLAGPGEPAAVPHESGLRPVGSWGPSASAPAGGVVSTAEDMVRWVKAQIDPPAGRLGDALRATHTVRRPADELTGIGLAWHVEDATGMVWHNGRLRGASTFCGFRKDLGVGIVVLVNTATYITDRLGSKVMKLAQGLETKPFELPVEIAVPLAGLAGRYELVPGVELEIVERDGGLHLRSPRAPAHYTFPLFASAPDRFFLRADPATMRFERGAGGQVTALVIEQYGKEQRATRKD